ncbi:MAG: CoA-binding protein [Proteobacteria bacterium]|nr:CoA-binding protein [Pseudomonadota bacterium]
MTDHPLEEILHPKSIAVVGASDSGRGGRFISPLQELGFKGKIFPVNPKYETVMGLKAYPRIKDIPEPVDFVISSIPADGVLEMIEDSAQKGVKGIHLFTARFSETGRKEAADLEKEVLKQAKKGGIRLIGPNCMGVYYPAEGIAFNNGMPKESGRVGLASQSGQAVMEIVGTAAQRGIRFSKAISYGNALDFNECDYLEYLTQDPQTDLILMYIEGVRDGRRFQQALRQATQVKPVVIVKGGRGDAGARAIASHTASMAGSRQLWRALIDQAGAVSAADLEELVDLAVAFNYGSRIAGRNVGVAGGGGGSSVLAADLCEEAGLNVIPLPQDVREKLKSQGSSIWDWISNPADFSIAMGDRSTATLVIDMMADHPDFDFIVVFVNGPWRSDKGSFSLDKHMENFRLHKDDVKPFVVVFDDRPRGSGSDADGYLKAMAEIKQRVISDNLPTFPTLGRAARSVGKMIACKEKMRP